MVSRRQCAAVAGTVAFKRSFAAPCIALLMLSVQPGHAETARAIKIIVPGTPGASNDILARLLAKQIEHAEGATLIVENRPGAGNVVGSEAAARAAPDGNTLLINTPPFVIDPYLRKLPYDPFTAFEPICRLANSPIIFVVNKTSPYRTLADLLTAARAQPRTVTVGGVGPGTVGHIAVEALKHVANVDVIFVAYPGNPPAVTALLGGHIDAVLTGYPVVAGLVRSGELRALATATPARIEPLPDLPTVAEAGYGDYGFEFWMGVVAPARTPPETISRLSGWFTAALREPATKAKLGSQGLYPSAVCGADFGAFLRKEYDAYGRMIRDINIKSE
jgi:tripartite-type tricarboxylate transporter receptor subunit TctC